MRAVRLLAVLLAAMAIGGCPAPSDSVATESAAPATQSEDTKEYDEPQARERPAGVVGYYVNNDPALYGTFEVPPGQKMYLGIEEGRWMMRNMLTAYGGTWTEGEEGVILTMTEGPTGKADGSEKLKAVRTETGVTLVYQGVKAPDVKFTFVAAVAPRYFGYDEFLGPKE